MIAISHVLDKLCLFVAVKTNPPSNVKVISEKIFPTSLLINWTLPIPEVYVKLTYQIRYCPNGSQSWTYVSSVCLSHSTSQSFLKEVALMILRLVVPFKGPSFVSEPSCSITPRLYMAINYCYYIVVDAFTTKYGTCIITTSNHRRCRHINRDWNLKDYNFNV